MEEEEFKDVVKTSQEIYENAFTKASKYQDKKKQQLVIQLAINNMFGLLGNPEGVLDILLQLHSKDTDKKGIH